MIKNSLKGFHSIPLIIIFLKYIWNLSKNTLLCSSPRIHPKLRNLHLFRSTCDIDCTSEMGHELITP